MFLVVLTSIKNIDQSHKPKRERMGCGCGYCSKIRKCWFVIVICQRKKLFSFFFKLYTILGKAILSSFHAERKTFNI